jgi:hypothetical protein
MAVRRGGVAAPAQRRPVELDLRRLARAELERMAAAGREIAECEAVLAKTGDTVVGELLRGQGFFEWDHYPQGEVYDPETNGLYYYHAHPPEARDPDEHGHFHTFLNAGDMPAEIRPLPAPSTSRVEPERGGLAHLVAIAMDGRSRPYRLFTTNRWVTGERWYRAKDVLALAERFRISHARPSWPANRWISAMLVLFRPQIGWLVAERDRVLAAWAKAHPGADAAEDRRLEILSVLPVAVAEQRRAVDAALAESARARHPALR